MACWMKVWKRQMKTFDDTVQQVLRISDMQNEKLSTTMKTTILTLLMFGVTTVSAEPPRKPQEPPRKPNIILYFADDISAREFPVYGSSTWTAPDTSDTSDPACRAQTPVSDQLAQDGCWIKTAWASTGKWE